MGRYPEALTAAEDAEGLYRALAADNPAAHRGDLAWAVHDLGSNLAQLGRYSEALTAVEEAVALYRAMAADNPAVYLDGLAWAVRNLGASLGWVGRYPEALTAGEEAVALYRALDQVNPAVFRAGLRPSDDQQRAVSRYPVARKQAGRRKRGVCPPRTRQPAQLPPRDNTGKAASPPGQ